MTKNVCIDLEPWLSGLSGLSGPVGVLSEGCRRAVGLSYCRDCRGLSYPVGCPVVYCRVFLTVTTLVSCRVLSGPVGPVVLSYCRTVGAVRQLSGNCRVTVGLCEAIIREVCEAGDKSRRN